MQFMHPSVEKEYARWIKLLGESDPYASRTTVGMHDVLRAHFLIVDFFMENNHNGIGGVGPKSVELLHSAIYRQFISFGGKDKWPTDYEKCATLLFGLVKDHPFHDANKRTAFLVTLYQLDRINRTPEIRQKEFEDFIVEIADDKLGKYARYREISKEDEDAEVTFIADYLKRNTRAIDNRSYTITYQELNQILKRHGFELANPYRNYIDVVYVEMKPRFLGIAGKTVRRESKCCQVGFPGWKRQVSKGDVRKVRLATGLTSEKGYDSKSFYEGVDPINSLIDMYSEPLRRLANR